MNKKYKVFIALMIVFSFILTACSGTGNTGVIDQKDKEIAEKSDKTLSEEALEPELNDPVPPVNSPQNLVVTALDIMQLIKDKNMADLSSYVHPSKGLSFTPHVHIVIGRDLVFTAQEVAGLAQDNTVYNWGYFLAPPADAEMHLNFNDYYDDFIYDEDYLNFEIMGNNTIVNTGDEIDNIHDEYPDADFIEFMIVGPAHNTGTDWRSLKLVFEESNGQSYLTGIVHGQWIDMGMQ